jgi:cell division protein FtsA
MNDLYKTQRAMRTMRKAAIQRGVIAVMDVGSSKVACLILRFDGPNNISSGEVIGSMAGQSGFRVIGAATTKSRGICFGEIESMAETERAIRTALQAAQKMALVRVDHVIAAFSGGVPRSYGAFGEVSTENETVYSHDIGRVLAACDLPDFGKNRAVLHAQPINFTLDDRAWMADPRGHIGQKLSVDLHVLTVHERAIQNLNYCVKRCDVELAGVASSAYVSAHAALVEDEQELGAACIDMGGGATGVSVFFKKHLISADSVRMGGDHVTRDISMGLQIPNAAAERIKTLYGGTMATGMDDREMIETDGNSGDWEHDRRQVSRSELIGIIRPRMEEVLEDVRDRLDVAGFDSLPGKQIVLTGGASQIPGLDGLAARILGQHVRLGRPIRLQGLPQAATGPAFSGVVGLALNAANPQDEWWDFQVPQSQLIGRPVRRAARWFKDNW